MSRRQDQDGRISLHEMRVLLSLFLPVAVQREQENVETALYTMDTQVQCSAGYIMSYWVPRETARYGCRTLFEPSGTRAPSS